MTPDDRRRIQDFLDKWQTSGGNERANYQGFFLDLCAALGVAGPPKPTPPVGTPPPFVTPPI